MKVKFVGAGRFHFQPVDWELDVIPRIGELIYLKGARSVRVIDVEWRLEDTPNFVAIYIAPK